MVSDLTISTFEQYEQPKLFIFPKSTRAPVLRRVYAWCHQPVGPHYPCVAKFRLGATQGAGGGQTHGCVSGIPGQHLLKAMARGGEGMRIPFICNDFANHIQI